MDKKSEPVGAFRYVGVTKPSKKPATQKKNGASHTIFKAIDNPL